MSRNVMLGFGAICWTAVAVVAIGHLAMGDLLVPAAMFLVFVGGLTLALGHQVGRAAAASVDR
jgi:hypothetical protein